MRTFGLWGFTLCAVLACGARTELFSVSQRAGAGGEAAVGGAFVGAGHAGFVAAGAASGSSADAGGGAGARAGSTGFAGGTNGGASSGAGGASAGTGGAGAGNAGQAGALGCALDGAPCDDADPCTNSDHCQSGQCVGAPLDCTKAPAPTCVADHTLRRYAPGTCALGACRYQATDSECLAGCKAGACAPLAASISVGESNACATVNHGPLKCWGGTFGGVNGPIDAVVAPTVVPGLESGVKMVSVGTNAACALTDTGAVKCWGEGYFTAGVVTVSGLPADVTSVACAAPYFDHTCVLSAAQGVKCWGSNNFGQLGDGTTSPSFTYQYTVVGVMGLRSPVTDISAGSNDTCAIGAGGQLWCWGMGRYGELGNGMFAPSAVPVAVSGLSSGTIAVSAGEEYSCAITAQGNVKCWGWTADGMQNVALPLDIAGVTHATSLSVDGAACAVTDGGALKCWGANYLGHLGNGNRTSSYTVAVDPVGMSAGVVAVGMGEYGACAVLESGTIRCWGNAPGAGTLVPKDLAGF